MALLQWNFNGYYAHLPELRKLIIETQTHYTCLQETRLRPDQIVNLRNFNTFRKDRQNDASGGVAILVEQSIYAEQINLITDLEVIAISTIVPNL